MKNPGLYSVLLTCVLLSAAADHVFGMDAVQTQKKMAINRLRQSGLTSDQAETYSMYLQIALSEATSWEIMDFSVTASLIAERGGSTNCNSLQCEIINGQLLSVDYMCYGSIETIGRTFSLNVQVADVGSGRQVANVSKFFKGNEKNFVEKAIPMVAKQIATTIIGKSSPVRSRSIQNPGSYETAIEQQAQKSFSDVRGYLDYSEQPTIETEGKLAFGYLVPGRDMLPDDVLRYSYQLQSYLADVGACAMLYIDEMEKLMKMRGGNLQCGTTRCAMNVGRLLGVDYMGYGKIRRRCGRFIIETAIINVEDGSTITEESRRFRGREIVFLTETIPQLAYKLGEVLERNSMNRE